MVLKQKGVLALTYLYSPQRYPSRAPNLQLRKNFAKSVQKYDLNSGMQNLRGCLNQCFKDLAAYALMGFKFIFSNCVNKLEIFAAKSTAGESNSYQVASVMVCNLPLP